VPAGGRVQEGEGDDVTKKQRRLEALWIAQERLKKIVWKRQPQNMHVNCRCGVVGDFYQHPFIGDVILPRYRGTVRW
jgi:hypothetical protein